MQKSGTPSARWLEQSGRGQPGWSGSCGPGEGQGLQGKCLPGLGGVGCGNLLGAEAGSQARGWGGGSRGREPSPELSCGHGAGVGRRDGSEGCFKRSTPPVSQPFTPLSSGLSQEPHNCSLVATHAPWFSLKKQPDPKYLLRHTAHCSPFLLKSSQWQPSQSDKFFQWPSRPPMTWSPHSLSDFLSWYLPPPTLLTTSLTLLFHQHLRHTCPRAFALTSFPPRTHFPQIALRLVPSLPSALGTNVSFSERPSLPVCVM